MKEHSKRYIVLARKDRKTGIYDCLEHVWLREGQDQNLLRLYVKIVNRMHEISKIRAKISEYELRKKQEDRSLKDSRMVIFRSRVSDLDYRPINPILKPLIGFRNVPFLSTLEKELNGGLLACDAESEMAKSGRFDGYVFKVKVIPSSSLRGFTRHHNLAETKATTYDQYMKIIKRIRAMK